MLRDVLDTVVSAAAGRRSGETGWSLDRAIWRAGELKLKEAEEPLLGLLARGGSARRRYVTIWALGMCGSTRSIATLNGVFASANSSAMDRRIAAEALLKVYDEGGRGAFRAALVEDLPASLRAAVRGGDPAELSSALDAYLGEKPGNAQVSVLETLYLIDGPVVRPALLAKLRTIPMKPPWFRVVRHLFKAAEYRRDGQVFGVLAWRFEKSRAMFRVGSYSTPVKDERGRWRYYNRSELQKLLKSEHAPLAYSDRTRWYLRRRVWWTLKRLGELDDPDYVKMAVGVLLPYTDEDAGAPKATVTYNWRGGSQHRHWGPWASYLAFNHVLYGESPRFFLPRGAKAFRYRPGVSPGRPAPSRREDAFQSLWDRVPQGLFHVLDESRCEPVHEFAVKAIKSNRALLSRLDADVAAMMLGAPYEVTSLLGLEVAERLVAAGRPQPSLVLAASRSPSSEVRGRGCEWLNLHRGAYLQDGAFLGSLMLSPHEDVRWYVRELLDTSSLSEDVARALVGRVLEDLLSFEAGQEALARDVSDLLARRFASLLVGLGREIVEALVSHPTGEVQVFGGDVLLARQGAGRAVPVAWVLSLLESAHAAARGRGLRLLAGWPDEVLKAHPELLMRMLLSSAEDMRLAARSAVPRLASLDAAFGVSSATRLVEMLLEPGLDETLSVHIAAVLKEELGEHLSSLSRAKVWALVRGECRAGQDLGGVLLAQHVGAEELEVDEWVALTDHEILSVRSSARSKLEVSLERARQEMGEALRVLDSQWEDTRQWAFGWFRRDFEDVDFPADVLVDICDSVRPDVQRFGREMITRFFREGDGIFTMVRLSEHPSTDLQLFVTNYLERYAAGDPERVEELLPYFQRVLCGINKGRTAKKRIYSFLRQEVTGSAASAALIAGLLGRISASISVEARAEALQTLALARRTWPGQFEVPFEVRQAPTRRRVEEGS